ncbi:M16 family metallopeptidase [Wenyingzhuangia aestuarii]|uniref:M16 family metallopeptidase n=1 Tax=Wenyingzhuangia aestuarii TaxID=1647582 RepID=UPI00143A35FE|nr:insulinase family protein [Wenyingzhuangia aestuarii]NJB83022.1 zinc protease [Wenyingzhuangia aestuarii]
MKKLLIASVFIFAIISCNSISNPKTKNQTATSSAIPTDTDVKKGTLSNGMTYYIRLNPKPEQKVELRLVVKAGSVLETDKQLGLAHFMEHMNFNGSKNFNKNELVDYLQSIGVKFGAHLNAYTSFDETVYILPIPTDNDEKLEKGFQILEDWAFNASLTDEEIDKERGVVLEEYRLGLGADKRMLKEYLPKLMYNSRYAERLPIGTKEVLENFTYEDLRSFYKDWYRPDLMAIVAVGDISVDVLEEKIKQHFNKYPAAKHPKQRTEYTSPNHKETLVSIVTDPKASRSTVQLYYKGKEKATPTKTVNDYKEDLTINLFNTMLNNRLEELKNSENPPFIYAGTWYGNLWDKSKNAYQNYAITSETGQLEAFKTLITENERVLRYGFLESELNRAKNALLNAMERAFNEKDKTESSRHASEYIQNFLNQEPIPGIAWEFTTIKELLPKITLDNCNSLIANYIHDDNRVLIFTGPDKKEVKKISENEVLNLLKEVKNTTLKPYEEKNLGALMSTIPTTGKITSIAKDTILNITKLTLSNGAKVSYKQTNFKNNQILFNGYSYGGLSLYTDEEILKTSLANRALTEAGVNGYSKTDLQKILAGKSVRVYPSIGGLSETINGSTTPKDLETFFQLTHLYFTKLNYDESAYNSYKNKQAAYLKNAISRPSTYFSIELDNFLNQNNPRHVGFPTEEKWNKTSYQLAYQKYLERFADASDFHFYFVGNFDEETLQNYCKTYLASLPSTYSKENYKNVSSKPLEGILEKHVTKGDEPKSLVKIIFSGTSENYLPNENYYLKSLGELLTIKLVEQLREEESGVYGVSARGNIHKLLLKKYNFTISFPCGPENVEKLSEKALAELEKIKKNGVSEKDLNKIKETQLLEHKEALKQNNFWIGTIKNADFLKTDVHHILNKEDKIKSLTSDHLKKVANKYLTKNRIIATLKPE